MNILRFGALTLATAGAVMLSGCVVAPADGAYYGDAYSTYSTPGYDYGYGTPYYGGSSLVIESSPTYVYGGRTYRRPGNSFHHARPSSRPGDRHSDRRPHRRTPSTGAHIDRPERPNGGNSHRGGGHGATPWKH